MREPAATLNVLLHWVLQGVGITLPGLDKQEGVSSIEPV